MQKFIREGLDKREIQGSFVHKRKGKYSFQQSHPSLGPLTNLSLLGSSVKKMEKSVYRK